MADTPFAFELKDTNLPLTTVVLLDPDPAALAEDLQRRIGDTPHFFDDAPVVLDLAAIRESHEGVNFPELARVLRAHRAFAVAVTGGSEAQMASALEARLPPAPQPVPVPRARPAAAPREVEVVREIEVVREVEVVRAQPALVIDRPLRSGQQVYAKGGDIVVLAAVNPGAEVIADGHVHVYAPLRGKAIAGAKGNTEARIITTCLEAELISIAGTYRTSETPIPDDLRGRPAQVRLVGDKLVMQALK